MAKAIFRIDINAFRRQALCWAQQFDDVCFFQSNGYADDYSQIDSLLAVKAMDAFTGEGQNTFSELENFKARYSNHWMPGFLSYDLKNEIENLTTIHPNRSGFPEAYFFVPTIVLQFQVDVVEIQAPDPHTIYKEILSTQLPPHQKRLQVSLSRKGCPRRAIQKHSNSCYRIFSKAIFTKSTFARNFMPKIWLCPPWMSTKD